MEPWELGEGETVPDVEMPDMAGRHVSTFTTAAQGVWRSEVSAEPVHYFDGAGWVDIDPTWHVEGEGYSSGANSFDVTIGSDPATSVASVAVDGLEFGYSLDGAQVSEATLIDPSTVEFGDVLSGVDLRLVLQPDGVKEALLLSSAAAGSQFVFPLSLDGVTATLVEGSVELRDGAGTVVAVIPPGWMADSANGPSGPALSEGVDYSLVPDGSGGTNLVVGLDETWLEHPERVFPIVVDPTIDVTEADGDDSVYDDTFVTRDFAFDNSSNTELKIGTLVANTNPRRSLLWFPLDGHFATDGTVDVVHTELTLQVTGATCPEDVELRPITEAWDDPPAWEVDGDPSPPSTGSVLSLDEDCTDDIFTATSATTADELEAVVEGWIEDGDNNHGLELRSPNETSATSLRLFASTEHTTEAAPELSVVWTYKAQYLQDEGREYGTDITCYPETTSTLTATYGSKCRADLYWDPTAFSATMPVVVLVHPGAWALTYDDDGVNPQYDNFNVKRRRDSVMRQTADALASSGYLVAVIDYRQGLRSYIGLNHLSALFHCSQAEPDYRWPPSSSYSSGYPCLSNLSGGWLNPSYSSAAWSAAADAVDDLQAAASWLQSDPTVASQTLEPSQLFVVGLSAGGYTAALANYYSASEDPSDFDAVVSIGGPLFIENLAIDYGSRSFPSDVAPMQFQTWEQDFVGLIDAGPPATYSAGSFDLGRQVFSYIRDTAGYPVELRARCGKGHIPDPTVPEQFDDAMGETVAFFSAVATAGTPEAGFWFGADGTGGNHFTEGIGQDLVEDLDGDVFGHYVGDFNGDGIDDILWFGNGDKCDTVWYGQDDADIDGRGTFARSSASDVVADGALTNPFTSVTPAEQSTPSEVLVGDFDGDGHDDLFLWKAGQGSYYVWYGDGDPNATDDASTGTFARTLISGSPQYIDEPYDQVAVGDFNGDGEDDVYFDETGGSGHDMVLYGDPDQGDFVETRFASDTADPAGAQTLLVGNFDGDAYDDVIFTDPNTANDRALYGKSGYNLFDFHTINVTAPFEMAVVGDFNGNGKDDVYYHDEASSSPDDRIWYGLATQGSFVPNTPSSPPVGAFDIQSAEFNGDLYADLLWHSTTRAAR